MYDSFPAIFNTDDESEETEVNENFQKAKVGMADVYRSWYSAIVALAPSIVDENAIYKLPLLQCLNRLDAMAEQNRKANEAMKKQASS